MHERMLNKDETPTFDNLILYSGNSGSLWLELDKCLEEAYNVSKQIRFPYGKDYGWSIKYSVKTKHICDIFAEKDAFAALFQISDKAVETIHSELSDYAKCVWADRHPCKNGGWIELRVLNSSQLKDLEKLIYAKINIGKK
jgi:hypothetical protein